MRDISLTSTVLNVLVNNTETQKMFTTSLFSSGEALKLPVSRAGGKVPERFCADLDLRLLFKDVIRNTVRRLQAAGCRLQAAPGGTQTVDFLNK